MIVLVTGATAGLVNALLVVLFNKGIKFIATGPITGAVAGIKRRTWEIIFISPQLDVNRAAIKEMHRFLPVSNIVILVNVLAWRWAWSTHKPALKTGNDD